MFTLTIDANSFEHWNEISKILKSDFKYNSDKVKLTQERYLEELKGSSCSIVIIQVLSSLDDVQKFELTNLSYYFQLESAFKIAGLYFDIFINNDIPSEIEDIQRSFISKVSDFLWFYLNKKNIKYRISSTLKDVKYYKEMQSQGENTFQTLLPLLPINSSNYRTLFEKTLNQIENDFIDRYLGKNMYQYYDFNIQTKSEEETSKVIKEIIRRIESENIKISEFKELANDLKQITTDFKQGLLIALNDFILKYLKESIKNSEKIEQLHIVINRINKTHIVKLPNNKKLLLRELTRIVNYLSNKKVDILPHHLLDSTRPNIVNLIIRFCFNNGVIFSNDDELLFKNINENIISPIRNVLMNCNLITIYLFAYLWQNAYKRSSNKQNLIKRFGHDSLDNLVFIEFQKYIQLARQYAIGLKEIAENIILHTNEKSGFLFFRFHKRTNSIAKDNVINLNDFFSSVNSDLKDSEIRYLEIVISDVSSVGIVNNYKSRNPEEDILINSFYKNNFDNIGDDSLLIYRCIANIGLKVFARLIKDSKGLFKVETNASNGKEGYYIFKDKEDNFVNNTYIDGTLYRIILPIKSEIVNLNIISQANIENISNLEEMKKWLNPVEAPDPIVVNLQDIIQPQSEKQQSFFDIQLISSGFDRAGFSEELANKIIDKYQEKKSNKSFLCINCSNSDLPSSILVKTIAALRLVNNRSYNENNMAIVNLPKNFMDDMRRALNIIGESAENRKIWSNASSLYLYFDEPENFELLIISGETTSDCDLINLEYSLGHGGSYNPIWSKTSIDKKIQQGNHTTLPYEVLLPANQWYPLSLFEYTTYKVLNKDIYSDYFGSKIVDTHVRLGSKLHIKNFYQAEMLFECNYYTDRFAYRLAKKINEFSSNTNSKILLVGYGEYSQMLISKIQYLIKDEASENYLIAEDVDRTNFKYMSSVINEIENHPDIIYEIAIIVPIASTLRTNIKIDSFIHKELAQVSKQIRIIFNTAVIVVRDNLGNERSDLEKTRFGWKEIDYKEKIIAIDTYKIHFSIFLKGNWRDPFCCDDCFPKIDFQKEKMLLETNKDSIVPFAIHSLPASVIPRDKFENSMVIAKRSLIDCIKYNHIERNNNHFLYYYDTWKFFNIESDLCKSSAYNIDVWMNNIKEIIENSNKEKKIIFNFIISPVHESNMGLINRVNRVIFKDSAYVIRFQFDAEYEINFKIKYSHIFNMLKNTPYKNNVKLNFYYVDDVIISGNTLNKAVYIISKYFKNYNIQFSIAGAIILIETIGSNFESDEITRHTIIYSYIKLAIPMVRDPYNHCYLCTVQNEQNDLFQKSLSYFLQKYFESKYIKQKLVYYTDKEFATNNPNIRTKFILENLIYFNLNYKYDNETIDSINLQKIIRNNLKINEGGIYETLTGEELTIEYKINFIKILSSPFIAYFREVREVTFSLLLFEIEKLLTEFHDLTNINYNYFLVLMKSLSNLNSNYIIRKENIIKIWDYISHFDLKDDNDFHIRYSAFIKSILYKDEIKSILFEKSLITGQDITEQENNKKLNMLDVLTHKNKYNTELSKQITLFYNICFIENGGIIYKYLKNIYQDLISNYTIEFCSSNCKCRNNCNCVEQISKIQSNINNEIIQSIEVIIGGYYYNNLKSFLDVDKIKDYSAYIYNILKFALYVNSTFCEGYTNKLESKNFAVDYLADNIKNLIKGIVNSDCNILLIKTIYQNQNEIIEAGLYRTSNFEDICNDLSLTIAKYLEGYLITPEIANDIFTGVIYDIKKAKGLRIVVQFQTKIDNISWLRILRTLAFFREELIFFIEEFYKTTDRISNQNLGIKDNGQIEKLKKESENFSK